jgi:hypothetical protein
VTWPVLAAGKYASSTWLAAVQVGLAGPVGPVFLAPIELFASVSARGHPGETSPNLSIVPDAEAATRTRGEYNREIEAELTKASEICVAAQAGKRPGPLGFQTSRDPAL